MKLIVTFCDLFLLLKQNVKHGTVSSFTKHISLNCVEAKGLANGERATHVNFRWQDFYVKLRRPKCRGGILFIEMH